MGQPEILIDNKGTQVPLGKCSHVYAYDGSGRLSTDTMTDGARTWVITYTYHPTTGLLTGESRPVRQ